MLFKVATKLQQSCHKVTVVQLEGYITLKISFIMRISFLQNLSSSCDVYNWSQVVYDTKIAQTMRMSVLYITSILLLQDLSTFYVMDHSSPVMLRSLLYLFSTLSVYSYQQCVATHHVPKCMSCHKAIFSYVMDIYCIYIYCKTLKYKLIVYLCRFILLILHVLHILI